MKIDKDFLDNLIVQAQNSERKRMNYDLRTSPKDGGQRMLNALLPGTEVPIHCHPMSNESILVLTGDIDEILYNRACEEIERIHLNPSNGQYGYVVPQGVWHTVEVHTPSVIYEAKDGKYGQDGSVNLDIK